MDEQSELDQLRQELEAARGGRERWRCPGELREGVARYAREEMSERGRSRRRVAADLGLSESCLGRWMSSARRREGLLRPVRLVASEPSGVVLVTPQGYRVEGLSVSAVASLLRAL